MAGSGSIFDGVSASDSCPGAVSLAYEADLGGGYVPISDPSDFDVGTTPVRVIAGDEVGHTAECVRNVEVLDKNEFIVDVELSPNLSNDVDRCVEFEFYDGSTVVATTEATVTFDSGTHIANNVSVAVDCPNGVNYDCVSARDKLHTLRSTAANFGIVSKKYDASFIGRRSDETGGGVGHRLVQGDLNDDGWINVVDFGAYVVRWATSPGWRYEL